MNEDFIDMLLTCGFDEFAQYLYLTGQWEVR